MYIYLLSIPGLFLLLVIINILQNGRFVKDPEMLPEIRELAGKDPGEMTVDDLRSLNKSTLAKIFQRAAPELPDGDFLAENSSAGILSFIVQLFTDRYFGPGKWVGKSFRNDHGFNIFGNDTYERKFEMNIKQSRYDCKDSLHLIYRPFNKKSFWVGSMHDEIRKINEKLYIGMGTTAWGFGKINPSFFFAYQE